jgi:hypothetical protein
MTDENKKLAMQIQELEEQLTKKDKLLEGYESKLEGYATKIQTIEKKLEDEIESSKAKDTKLEDTEKGKEEITEQLLEFKDKMNKQDVVIDKLQEDNFLKGLAPLFDDLIELDGKEMETIYHDKALEAYKSGDEKKLKETIEFLTSRSKKLVGAAQAITTSLEETSKNAQFRDEELEDEATKKQRDTNAFKNMPKEFYAWKKKRGEM